MTDKDLTYADCYNAALSVADEIVAEHQSEECSTLEDFMDLAHEYVDGHEFVIYYYRAHQFVCCLPTEFRDAAKDMIEETSDSKLHYPQAPLDYDKIGSLMAYWGMLSWVTDLIEQKLEKTA